MNRVLLVICSLITSSYLNASWHDKKAEGWAWYEDKEEKSKTLEETKPVLIAPKSATDQIKEIKAELEEKLSLSLLNPTPENIQAYIELQNKWINQSADFAKSWSKVILNNPDLNTAIQNPTSQYGIQINKKILKDQRKNLIENLAKTNGLFFFYNGKDKISQAMGTVVSNLMKDYGWKIIPISVDKHILPNFPNTKLDNGISNKFNVEIFPSLFIVSPENETATPIAYGFVTQDVVEQNIELQFQNKESLQND